MPENGTPRSTAACSRLLRWTRQRWRTRWITESLSESAKRRRAWQVEPALAEIVDLKFFCGFSFTEIAAMGDVSEVRCSGTGRKRAFIPIEKFARICRSEELRCPHSAPISGRL